MLLKNGCRICGTGGALGTAPIVQNKAYFQVSVQQSGKVLLLFSGKVLLLFDIHVIQWGIDFLTPLPIVNF